MFPSITGKWLNFFTVDHTVNNSDALVTYNMKGLFGKKVRI